MRYLAQVHKNEFLKQYELRLLAREEAEHIWSIIPEEAVILLGKGNTMSERLLGNTMSEGLLVLVELSATGDIERLEDATNWVLHLVQAYLSTGVSPDFLQQEAERAEHWRQTLTLQNQDLARRSLELEARREQIQALEESIKKEKNGHHKQEQGDS
ncbi:hypothetical protein H6G41_17670 [Tolypothrix sp. FACHB-123]|uniref:hypothetical protein n=1 Tax=Tolypothrix sp. FACHB-123 TaxID=2692868 RepID=UPI001688C9F0|nr:hypothetical protein [Tolypothrix sp. FACHB-123]MBD2356431.1 hypothetical protein [Tolypothrix sp. FACHB-123]